MLYTIASDFHESATTLDLILTNYKDTQIVLLGDYFDNRYYPNAKEMMGTLLRLANGDYNLTYPPMLIKGNHDDLMLGMFDEHEGRANLELWLANGGDQTLKSLDYYYNPHDLVNVKRYLKANYQPVLEMLDQAPTSIELENIIFVHAGLDLELNDPLQSDDLTKMWIRDDYLNYPSNPTHKVIVSGHTAVQNINNTNHVVKLKTDDNTPPRYVIDGGAKSDMDDRCINVLTLNENGEMQHVTQLPAI